MDAKQKLWGGRFEKPTNKAVEDFHSSIRFDCRLYRQDIDCLLYTSKSEFLKPLRQPHKGGIRHDLPGRNEKIPPRFIAVCLPPTGRDFAILDTTFFLGYDIRFTGFILAFYFNEINKVCLSLIHISPYPYRWQSP